MAAADKADGGTIDGLEFSHGEVFVGKKVRCPRLLIAFKLKSVNGLDTPKQSNSAAREGSFFLSGFNGF